jgi:hypothetical protein
MTCTLVAPQWRISSNAWSPRSDAAAPAIQATILAYLVVSVFAIVPYVVWRRRAGVRPGHVG